MSLLLRVVRVLLISFSPLAQIDKSNFEIAVAKRVYKFNDRENNASAWVKKINETALSHTNGTLN